MNKKLLLYFPVLSKVAMEKDVIDKYYAATKGMYRNFFAEKGDLDINKFGIRYYRAKKNCIILRKCLF